METIGRGRGLKHETPKETLDLSLMIMASFRDRFTVAFGVPMGFMRGSCKGLH